MSTKRVITTNLMKKEEVFKILALGEATSLPILLIGDPGVAKTAAVIDFAKASVTNGTLQNDDVFLLETDEGTRSNEIKGTIDLEELTLNQKFVKNSPITKAKYVVINEVDKASASLRNAMLGVMNEKILFDGKNKVPCQWDAFIATCNKIPEDEVDSPFWDRFLVTFHVERLRQSEIMSYYDKGGKAWSKNVNITLPEQADIDAITLDPVKIKKTIDIAYSKLSDRTLSYLPTLVKNIMVIWNYDESRGLVKAVELLIGKDASKELAKNIVSRELRAIYDKIDQIGGCVTSDQYESLFDDLNKDCERLNSAGKLSPSEIEDIKNRLSEQESKLDFLVNDEEEIKQMDEQISFQ